MHLDVTSIMQGIKELCLQSVGGGKSLVGNDDAAHEKKENEESPTLGVQGTQTPELQSPKEGILFRSTE